MTLALEWLRIVRLGLIQASIGAIVVFSTSTLNRIMVVELALPAIVPGALVAFHYAVQMLRPRWGHGSDLGGRRTPWILSGMVVLAAGSVLAAVAATWMPNAPGPAVLLAVVAYGMIGIGVGAAGTSLLLLLAAEAGERRRAAAATVVWMMMIAGFIVTAAVAGHMLEHFSARRVVEAAAAIAGGALLVSALAVWGVERAVVAAPGPAGRAERRPFLPALREVWAEPEARRFTIFVFLSMLAYSAQELILEPFAGTVFALSPAESARLAGLQHSGLLGGMMLVALLGSAVGGPVLGSMRLWTVGGCLASAVAVLALAFVGSSGSAGALRGCVVVLGIANGTFSIAAVAAMMQLAGVGQPGRSGVRMGLWGAAQALAFAAGGLVGTGASDLARHLLGSPALAYAAVFIGEAGLFCAAASLATRAFPRSPGTAGNPSEPASGAAPREDPMGGLAFFDAVVVGGGPAGATAASDLARRGRSVLLLDRAGRIKPCGGAIPPRLLADFDVPDHLLVARATAARLVSPRNRQVHMPVEGSFVGMVDREAFDEWLRVRAVAAGATRRTGTFVGLDREPDGGVLLHYRVGEETVGVRTRAVVGADGARSEVARRCMPTTARVPFVFAYHEIVVSPENGGGFDGARCDIYYRGSLSPDFYGWIFPHGSSTSIGTGSARKGFSLKAAVAAMRQASGLSEVATLRREGAPIPLKLLRRWDDGRNVILAGDAAGMVAPASGEGIYYAMVGGRLVAEAVDTFLATGDARALRTACARFGRLHGGVFRALGAMQRFWYANDWLRERFVALCGDRDIQRLVWTSYLNKSMSREPAAVYLRIALRNLRQLANISA